MQYWSQTALIAMLAAGMVAITGCSTQSPAPAHGSIPSLPFSVVATGDSAADIGEASTFSWAQPLQQSGADQTRENESIDNLLQGAISETLETKGYRYYSVPGEGDLVVSYHVALDDGIVDRNPVDTNDIQLQPSLNVNSPDPAMYEKGTLVITVKEKSTGLTVWRSALQGFTMHGLGEAERRQRVGLMVDSMLAGLPAK